MSEIKSARSIPAALVLLTLINIAAQTVLFRDELGEGAVTRSLGIYTDGLDYLGRAERLAGGATFSEVFGDGVRMPGYPLFLAALDEVFENPAGAARAVQIVLSSMVIPAVFLVLLMLTGSLGLALAGAAAAAVWAPLYYFSPLLYAESLCIFLMAALLLVMALLGSKAAGVQGEAGSAPGIGPSRSRVTGAGAGAAALIAAAVYLKPNEILLAAPFAAFSAYALKNLSRKVRIRFAAVSAAVMVLALAPWSAFLSSEQGAFVPLTTHGGWNLYLGTGARTEQGQRETGSIQDRVKGALGITDGDLTREYYFEARPRDRARLDGIFREAAAERWKKMPGALAVYGAAKVLHSFGFSMRDPRDLLILIQALAALAASAYLWRRDRWREWSLLLWSVIIVTSLQAFLFLGEQRFKTVFFDLPALIVTMLGVSDILERVRRPMSRS